MDLPDKYIIVGEKFVVRSHMSDKAIKRVTEKLKRQIEAIEHCENVISEKEEISHYNLMVAGIHNYYQYATFVNIDCAAIQFQLNTVLYNRLKDRLKNQGTVSRKYIAQRYGNSKMIRYIADELILSISLDTIYSKRVLISNCVNDRIRQEFPTTAFVIISIKKSKSRLK